MPVTEVSHPLLESLITSLRQPVSIFFSNPDILFTYLSSVQDADLDKVNDITKAISRIIAVKATEDLPLTVVENLKSPVASFKGKKISSKIGLCPVLRAGLSMVPAFRSMFPGMNIPTYHLGLYRDKTSLEPVEYYSKLPRKRDVDTVFILDPVIATGGTANAGTPQSSQGLVCLCLSDFYL